MEMNRKDYYKILGVSEDAAAEVIKKSYRNLAFRYHPDRSHGNEELMKEVNEAYAVLSNPSRRAEYDALRRTYGSFARDRFRRTYTDEDIFRDSDIGHIFEELSRIFGLNTPQDIFGSNSSYGPHYRTFKFRGAGYSGHGFFGYGPMGRTHSESHKTGRLPVFPRMILKGINLFQKAAARRLGIQLPEDGRDWHDVLRLTPEEASTGGKVRYLYRRGGNSRELLVKIPPRIKEGQKIKLRGLGGEGKNGGKSGSLFLKVDIRTSFLTRLRNILAK